MIDMYSAAVLMSASHPDGTAVGMSKGRTEQLAATFAATSLAATFVKVRAWFGSFTEVAGRLSVDDVVTADVVDVVDTGTGRLLVVAVEPLDAPRAHAARDIAPSSNAVLPKALYLLSDSMTYIARSRAMERRLRDRALVRPARSADRSGFAYRIQGHARRH
jgi:hypothetical protein